MRVTSFPMAALLLLFTVPSGDAALRVGLGSAVAKRSAKLIDKAAEVEASLNVGDRVASTLPSCPAGSVYDALPTDLSTIAAIDPLGHVSPPGHTFPSDHIYFYKSTSTATTPPIYAPGDIHMTEIARSDYLSASPAYSDYSIYFYGCRELKSYYYHVRTLSSGLQAKVGSLDNNCFTYSTGGSSIRRCSQSMNVTAVRGELIGYGSSTGAFDFGTYDYRRTPIPFATPSRHYGDQPYTVCPIDYFAAGPKASMEALLGRFDGGYPRSIAPRCGTIDVDIAGTAHGDWYHPGSADSPEDPHLALVPNNVYADRQVISIGTSVTGQTPGFYTFVPATSGQVNRDFSQVTPDGLVYCYDSFFDPAGQSIGAGPRFFLQMTSNTTLRFERDATSTCGAGPWSFSANAVAFQR